MLNLDTHIVLHALSGTLTSREKRLLSGSPWGISDIVLWEIAKLVELGRVELDLDDQEVRAALRALHVWPIDLDVCLALREIDFKSDPADELIAATSLVHRAPLVTRDRAILKSRVVPLA
ncbi:MAG: PIN domain-containing protein [Deltaproteobacteria bacterium]|nr:PIN domain-containing protein [Deltaproteobacteria bacterium]